MLGWRPWKLYSYMWRYGSVLAMLCLLLASLVNLCLGHPTYQAWDRAEVRPPTSLTPMGLDHLGVDWRPSSRGP